MKPPAWVAAAVANVSAELDMRLPTMSWFGGRNRCSENLTVAEIRKELLSLKFPLSTKNENRNKDW